MEIHFLQVKFYAIGVYLEPEVVNHLQQWKGKSAKELEDSDDFFDALITGKLSFFNAMIIYNMNVLISDDNLASFNLVL